MIHTANSTHIDSSANRRYTEVHSVRGLRFVMFQFLRPQVPSPPRRTLGVYPSGARAVLKVAMEHNALVADRGARQG